MVSLSTSQLHASSALYTLQIDAFQTKREAQDRLTELQEISIGPILIDIEPDAPQNAKYRILVGEFDSKDNAVKAKAALKKQHVPAKVRMILQYDAKEIDLAISGQLPNLIRVKQVPSASTETLAAAQSEIKSVRPVTPLGKSTTSPKALRQYRSFINQLPDNHPAKAGEVLTFAYRKFSGRSSYSENRPDYIHLKSLLRRVANKSINGTHGQSLKARELYVHLTHYYDRDYVAAIRGYHQLIKYAEKRGHYGVMAAKRASLAGALYELSKSSGYPLPKTESALYDLWHRNCTLQDESFTSNPKQAKVIRSSTSKIGLMLTEIYLQQKMWPEAESLAKLLISSYESFDECMPAVAESYCHLTHVYAVTGRPNNCYESGEKATSIAEKIGKPIWGDNRRDVGWKSLAWQRRAAVLALDEKMQSKIEDVMRTKYPEQFANYFSVVRK